MPLYKIKLYGLGGQGVVTAANILSHAVSINESIDLAKYFSNSESGRFVNGILDNIRKELKDEN